ncbi:sigma-54 dependent transcriptional regulator [Amaricoccus sp.]|uniref:sigma-54-dependent transcriptional regulator n=1 Tax=Amaricoccus sp. TaxID=1872485 RepID=UPI001B6ED88B|nr:sigma-54 dependent transcriptional regulator [Amaricoccus sp.]MBP7241582.1 sigma-54-dependent Fis family transcriptional regulator [Amaricoccus sp.]
MQNRVLIVEDTSSLSMVYEAVLTRAGHLVNCAASLAEARAACAAMPPRLVLLDLQLPDGDGLDLLDELHRDAPECRVVVITANGSINRAVEAMRAGAFDFLVKPFDESRLIKAVDNAIATLEPFPPEEERDAPETFEGFIGRSAPMQEIYRMVRAIGRSTATVFITGESGTGKEVCARAIHAVSTRARKPFVPLNCAAIPRDLLESEVFGHLKGAFTGALSDKPGAAAVADGGTLFLDEICEMDLSLQTKLLRFLQTSTIQPVGAARPIPVDVRIVCATNRDPAEEVRQGRFREDLYYRLHVVPIHMPPLRQRPEDVVDIARAVLVEYAAEEGKAFVALDPRVEGLFAARPWPGNVRQLLNVIRNIVVLHDGAVVLPDMLPPEVFVGAEDRPAAAPAAGWTAPPAPVVSARNHVAALVGTPLAEVERELIEATIEHCDGSIPRAARMLELSPSTIYRKLESWAAAAQRRAGE